MPRRAFIFLSLGLLSLLGLGQTVIARQAQCQIDNADLRAMPIVQVSIGLPDGSQHLLDARLADNNATRAAGFQRVCAATIADTPILFVFPRAFKPQFHMHNVVAPIDIAFIQESGAIESIQSMQPYVLGSRNKPLYGPAKPVIAALEARPGFFSDLPVTVGAVIEWQEKTD